MSVEAFIIGALTGIGVIGALIWRGTIKKIWLANGFSYNQFVLMVKMEEAGRGW